LIVAAHAMDRLPYTLLRSADVAKRLGGLLLGRRAFWSGTPTSAQARAPRRTR
jgi:hypothetical protein